MQLTFLILFVLVFSSRRYLSISWPYFFNYTSISEFYQFNEEENIDYLISNKIIFSKNEIDSDEPIFKLLTNKYKPYEYYKYDQSHFTNNREIISNFDFDQLFSEDSVFPYRKVKAMYDWSISENNESAPQNITDAISNNPDFEFTPQIKHKLKVYYNGLLNLMNLQILNTIQNITEEDQNLKNLVMLKLTIY